MNDDASKLPSSGFYDASLHGEPAGHLSGATIKTALLGGVPEKVAAGETESVLFPSGVAGKTTQQPDSEGVEEPEDLGAELIIAKANVPDSLDLSYCTVTTRLTFVDCTFEEPLSFERADLAGLELYRCTVRKAIGLDWARIRGDLRLIGLNARDDLRLPAPVSAVGTVVRGAVDLTQSQLSDSDEEALVASASRGTSAAEPGVSGNSWDLVLQAAGLGAALAAWVAVVGGARLWARMSAIDAPALPTLAGLGQGWMVAEGLQTLLLPMLLGVVVSVLVYFSRWQRRPSDGPAGTAPSQGAGPQEPSAPAGNETPQGAGPKEPSAPAGNETPQGAEPQESSTKKKRSKAEGGAPEGRRQRLNPGRGLPVHRLRPLIAMRRLGQRTSYGHLLGAIILGGLLAAGLLVIHASWQVLVSTAIIVLAGLALATLVPEEPDGKRQAKRETEQAIGRRNGHVRKLPAPAVVVLSGVSGVVFYFVWERNFSWRVLLAAIAAALLVAAFWWAEPVAKRGSAVGWLTSVIVIVGVLFSMVASVEIPWLLFMGVVTALAIWVTLGAVVDKTPRAAAITVFVAIVVWSGALGYAREIGDRTPDLPLASVALREGGDISGFFLGRSATHIFIAPNPRGQEEGELERHVVTLADEDVERITYGETMVLPPSDGSDKETEPPWWDFVGNPEGELPTGEGAGAEGTPPSPDTSSDDPLDPADNPVEQPTYVPPRHEAFNDVDAAETRDEVVSGIPARLELLGLNRSDDVIHLDMRIRNMSQTPQSVVSMLGLDGSAAFDTPRLTDTAARRVYEVSCTPGGQCDCSDLEHVKLDSFESRRLWAIFVVPGDVTSLDLTVPNFGSFQDVPVR